MSKRNGLDFLLQKDLFLFLSLSVIAFRRSFQTLNLMPMNMKKNILMIE